MGLLDAFKSHRDTFDSTHHGSLTHDVLAGAVAYEALKAYEAHCAKHGKPANHAKAKEVAGGFVAAAFTHLASTKGLDAWDAHKRNEAQQKATERVNTAIDQSYQ